jgi:hypothetical protein
MRHTRTGPDIHKLDIADDRLMGIGALLLTAILFVLMLTAH